MIARHRLLPSRRILVAGQGAMARRVAGAAREAGAEVRELGAGYTIAGSRGSRQLTGLDLLRPDGTSEIWLGGTMAACGPRVPVFELGAEAGADTVLLPAGGFALVVDDTGRTRVADVLAAGSCCNATGDSGEQGTRVAELVSAPTLGTIAP
jgi:hypothetical protein